MPATSARTIDLEDFRRLGVRPNESRLSVIRRAAMRSAKGLAAQQLAKPSEQGSKQLSRVATSAYRLLDPRKRDDFNQRVHVGRILPNTLSWVGQTGFSNEPVTASVDPPFSPVQLTNAELVESLDLDTSPRVLDVEADWATSLSDGDLLRTTRWARNVNRVRSRFRYPFVLLAISGVAIGTVLGFATLGNPETRLTLRRTDPPTQAAVPLESKRSLEQPIQPRASESSLPPRVDTPSIDPAEGPRLTTPPATAPQPPTAAMAIGSVEPEPNAPATLAEIATPAEISVDSPTMVPSGPEPRAESADQTLGTPALEPEVPALEMSAEPKSPATSDMTTKQSGAEKETVIESEYLADPFGSPETSLDPPETSELIFPEVMLPHSRAENQDEAVEESAATELPTLRPFPDQLIAAATRTQLIAQLPQLAISIRPEHVPKRIEEIETLERDLAAGTPEVWTYRMMVAELAWLVEDVNQVSERLKSLTDHYDVTIGQTLSESFRSACLLAFLPETHQHLMDNGLRLANQLMINESFEASRQVVDALAPSSDVLESQSSSEYLRQFSKTIGKMERLAESARRVVDEDGELVGGGDVGIVGRYYCLMLRRWDEGLSWLAETSDPRIAGLARQELDLAKTATADDRITLAQRWFAAASRSSGRPSDSMRLHAIEMLHQAHSESAGLSKLEIERLIDVNQELLPRFLAELRDASATPDTTQPADPQPAADPSPVSKNPAPAPKKPKSGLRGRIEIDGQDIGVQLDYELDVAMTRAIFDRIADQLNLTLSKVSIQLVGEIELEDSASLLVSIAEPDEGLKQRVQFDTVKLEFDSLNNTARVDAGAGKHEIVWTIEADSLSRVFLRLRDGETGQRIDVKQPMDSVAPPTVLTVAMVRSTD